MHRLLTPILIVCCLAGLLAACYGRALLGGEQFGYRDAVQYFYPLYWRVQAEWRAGQWPLWEPAENAGVPLLGNPSAAVLYPGKVLYGVLPYPWAARLYVVVHTLLAFAAMGVLLRSWGASATASALAGLAYGFGAPVLFQYCNVIYLVGAAWAPLGFRAADRWLRLGRRWGLIELAVVLALMVLGGDPESAYVLGVAAAGHAVALTWWPGREERPRPPGYRRRRLLVTSLIAIVLAVVWVGGTLELARRLPGLRAPVPGGLPPAALPWMRWVPTLVVAGWGSAGLALLAWWWQRKRLPALGTRLVGLFGSAMLAAALAAAQLLPALEFSGQTDRASIEDPHDIYPFSLEPLRAIELAWPNVFGTRLAGNRSWLEATRPGWAEHTRVWVPSLYVGGLTLVLALGAVGFRGDGHGPQRRWLSAVALVSLIASLGEYTGPLWWARCHPAVAAALGPHDPPDTVTIRRDGQLRDGDGSVYWALATVLPGFRWFRFPSKLLCTTALATAGLAGLGWDRLTAGLGRRRTAATAAALLAVGLVALMSVTWARPSILAALRSSPAATSVTMFGPLDAEGAIAELRRGLAHGSTVLVSVLVVVWLVHTRRSMAAAALALIVMTADLALANARLVLTVPQSLLDATPEVVRIIAAAERRAAHSATEPPGPFRVHRMPMWYPALWSREASEDRIEEFDRWEHDTIRPKYGLLHGIEYTLSSGVAEIDAYAEFFGGLRIRADAATAGRLGLLPGQPLIVFPRRSFDMWNTRYFVLPANPNGWNDETRAYAAFVTDAERIYPPPDAFEGPDGPERRRRWVAGSDFQVFRNRAAYPRAWVVHDARSLPAPAGSGRAGRDAAIRAILSDSSDPRHVAWLDADKRVELTAYLPGTPPLPSEIPAITVHKAQEVAIDVALEQPGLVVMADTYAPGWHLTIDGAQAPIHRTNLMMRGAAVTAGRHHLVFRYEPRAFRIGMALSSAGLAVLVILGGALWVQPAASGLPAVATPPGRTQ